jgi:hypothetical protein
MQPTNAALQVFYGTLPLIATALLAMWNNNARLTELSKRMDDLGKRVDDLRGDLGKRIDDLAARVLDLEKGTRLIQQR